MLAADPTTMLTLSLRGEMGRSRIGGNRNFRFLSANTERAITLPGSPQLRALVGRDNEITPGRVREEAKSKRQSQVALILYCSREESNERMPIN